jgi:phosphatidylinositol alpha 1,6-mannosyltransferase
MPRTKLVVVGDGPSERKLREQLPRAEFLGFRGGDELAEIYASLDVFVHTGPSETFCQAVQEALASGVPVVALDSGGPKDLVAHGRTGYLVPAGAGPGDLGAGLDLRAAVEALGDDDFRRRCGLAARRSVIRRDWGSVCDQLVGHYGDVLGIDRPADRAA